MAIDIKVPSVGESISEGTLARWLRNAGDLVRADEPIVELETDKATQEIVAPADGKLAIKVKEGERVAIGAVIGQIEPAAVPVKASTAAPLKAVTLPSPAAEPLLSPAARQHAADAGIDPSKLTGTGRGGRVIKEDVLNSLSAVPAAVTDGAAQSPPALSGRERRERISPIRQRIAERLLAAQQNAAILTTFNEADMSAVLALRAKYKEAFQKKHGVGLGFMSFFVKACIEGLRSYPAVNAFLDGGDIIYHEYFHIGVAVSTEKGLMVPVLRDADRLSFAAIEQAITALAQKAREGKVAVGDLQGGTFTITNGGVFGSLLSTPILNPPQSGILGMHTIQKRPVVVDEQIVVRPMMYLAFSYDHRLIDGREAVGFLMRVKECIEAPERMVIDV